MNNYITTKNPNPGQRANIFSKLTFVWAIKLFYRGIKQNLKINDLYESLPSDKSERLCNLLEKKWNAELEISKKKISKPSLLRAIYKTFFWSFMLQGLIQFLHSCVVRLAQPVLLSIFISLFSEIEARNSTGDFNSMYLYGGLFILTTIIYSFLFHHTAIQLTQIGMQIRIACCSLIYRKMLRLSKKSLGHSAVGQIVNLLSNDVGRFDWITLHLHYLWIMPIQTATVTYLIWQEVKVASVIGVGSLFIITLPMFGVIGKIASVLRLKIAKRTDKRVKIMAEIISGIQVIKMYAWEKPFAKVASQIRISEIKVLSLASYVRGVILSSSVFIERTALFITVVSYVLLGNNITSEKVFSTAQFFNILQLSIAIYYPSAVSIGAETLISIRRLQEFLMLEENEQSSITKTTSRGVNFKNISASWTTETKILKNINIEIVPGSLCVIIGPVGAGKSSLLQIVLGELVQDHGTVEVGGDISYASQEPWLFSSSVQKNILFGKAFDQQLYDMVVKVCALERDFELLPHGDKTLVGERGVLLSGGQKARINLARAVYTNADIYLLDDPLSAVDTHVGKHLFEKCMCGYLKKKTRILVTHQLQYLKKADHIVVINEGKIEAQGTFSELSNTNLNFTTLLVAADENDNSKENASVDKVDKIRKVSLSRSESILSSISIFTERSEGLDLLQNNMHPEEEINSNGTSAYWEYAKAGGNCLILLGLFACFVGGQVSTNAADLWLTHWVSEESTRHSTCSDTNSVNVQFLPFNDTQYTNRDNYFYQTYNISKLSHQILEIATICDSLIATNTAVYIYLGIILLSIILLISRSIYFFKVVMTSSKNLHNRMFNSLLQAPMKFFDKNPSGRVLNRFSRDIGIIDEILPRVMIDALQILLVMIGILLLVAISNIYLLAVAVVLIIIFYKVCGWYSINAKNIKHLEGVTRSPVFSHLSASLNGITTIRASSAESLLMREFDLHQDTHTSAWYLLLVCMTMYGLLIDMISIIYLTFVVFSFVIIAQYGVISSSMVGLAVSQSLVLIGMVQYGLRQTAEVVSQMTCVERVLEYTKLNKEETQKTPEDINLSECWPDKGAIDFIEVSLKYSDSEPLVLKNLNFTVKAGEKIGIVGRTGAGKSSLIAALFRLTPIEGKILIDGINTQIIGLNDMRKKISIIPQEPVLFSATLRYNLDPFSEFSDEKLWNALEDVELKNIALSLDFFVQESGSNFSVGQRQLLCLARAILRNNKILVLDEATANVDPQTDGLIQKTIRNKFSSCTVLTIAHRLHTIMDSDKVLVMDAGMLVEYDHPHKLLQNAGGYLCKMVAQTGPSMTAQLHAVAESTYLKSIKEEEN